MHIIFLMTAPSIFCPLITLNVLRKIHLVWELGTKSCLRTASLTLGCVKTDIESLVSKFEAERQVRYR